MRGTLLARSHAASRCILGVDSAPIVADDALETPKQVMYLLDIPDPRHLQEEKS
jgi:hypothetical protein